MSAGKATPDAVRNAYNQLRSEGRPTSADSIRQITGGSKRKILECLKKINEEEAEAEACAEDDAEIRSLVEGTAGEALRSILRGVAIRASRIALAHQARMDAEYERAHGEYARIDSVEEVYAARSEAMAARVRELEDRVGSLTRSLAERDDELARVRDRYHALVDRFAGSLLGPMGSDPSMRSKALEMLGIPSRPEG